MPAGTVGLSSWIMFGRGSLLVRHINIFGGTGQRAAHEEGQCLVPGFRQKNGFMMVPQPSGWVLGAN